MPSSGLLITHLFNQACGKREAPKTCRQWSLRPGIEKHGIYSMSKPESNIDSVLGPLGSFTEECKRLIESSSYLFRTLFPIVSCLDQQTEASLVLHAGPDCFLQALDSGFCRNSSRSWRTLEQSKISWWW